jgi:hypothetical protein
MEPLNPRSSPGATILVMSVLPSFEELSFASGQGLFQI